jgi:hypothetical protein
MKKIKLLLSVVLLTIGISATKAAPEVETVTIGSTGYATYCSSNPLYLYDLVVPEPIGRWTFDDPSNLLAGTGAATLTATKHAKNNVTQTTLADANITAVTGPDASNGAVNVPIGSSLLMAANNGATSMGTYTVMFDVCAEDANSYVPLLQNSLTDGKDGSLFFHTHQVGLGGGLGYHGTIKNNTWYRIVFVVQPNGASLYVDGNQLVSNLNLSTPYNQHWLLTTGALFFADESGEEKAIKTSELRFWDVALDEGQVAKLGSISGDAPKFPEALGVWTFDDATDPYAGTGTATLAKWGNSSSFADGVATVPVGAGIELSTNLESTPSAYTLMQDVKFADVSGYISLFQNDVNNGKDGSIFIKNGTVGLASAGLGYNGTINTDTWYRIVTVIDNSYCTLYVDGVKVGGPTNIQDTNAWAMRDSRKLILFIDNDGEEKEVQLAEARFWDLALTAAQVAQLATVGTTTYDGQAGGGEPPVAYTGKIVSGGLSLTELSGGIPANTAVVLKGTPNTVYRFVVKPTGLPAVTDNDLQGSDGTVTGNGSTIFALSSKANGVGFYPVGNGVTIPAGKAYLEYTGSNPVKGFTFVFDDDATGISLTEDGRSQMEDGAIYNLAGQRVSKMQKGINIVNGKKVLK